MKEFDEILKGKREYYGNTKAALQFATEEYERQGVKTVNLDALVREKIALVAENKKLKMMIDNGLGWEDMTNDIAPMQER